MPYQSRGRRVYVKKGGKWKKKAKAKSPASAKRMVSLLRSKKHGKKRKK